jgi:hypothetical protein
MHQLHIPTQMSTVQARPLMSLNTVVQLNQMLSSQAADTCVTVQLHMDTPLKHNRICHNQQRRFCRSGNEPL